MKWSLKITQFRGIPVYVHATLLILIFWMILTYWIYSNENNVMFTGILFVLAFFFSVVLHEIGHTLLANKFKIKIRDITLLPIGGVVRLDQVSDDPKQELWRAISGPLVNLLIATSLLLFITPTTVFDGIPVRNANIKNIQILNSDDTLGKAVEMILAGAQQDFPLQN